MRALSRPVSGSMWARCSSPFWCASTRRRAAAPVRAAGKTSSSARDPSADPAKTATAVMAAAPSAASSTVGGTARARRWRRAVRPAATGDITLHRFDAAGASPPSDEAARASLNTARGMPIAGSTMPWSETHVRRLFWRAGFGATPAEATRWAQAGQDATIRYLLNGPRGLAAQPAPMHLDPLNEWSHRPLWWLDRMVRTQRPLEEKLTLFWHDHFATADQDTPLMLAQNRMLRARSTGSFRKLLGGVARDPAMQLFLSLANSTKDAPNENFARELMELFTLGGGYTERDIREAARALTGFRSEWKNGEFKRIWFDRTAHDAGVKRIFGRRGRFGLDGLLDLVVAHPRHAPFLVRKLWSFFVTEQPSAATVRWLARVYRSSGHRIAPVVDRILRQPALYARLDAADMVKCPLVYVAGTLRTAGVGVTIDDYSWLLSTMGQQPFSPPSVAGWDWGAAWLTSQTVRAGVSLANAMIGWDAAPMPVADGSGDAGLAPDAQVERALDALGRPWVSDATRGVLTQVARDFFS